MLSSQWDQWVRVQSVDTETSSSVQFLYIEQRRPSSLVWLSLGNKRERERERERLCLSSLSLLSDDDELLITRQSSWQTDNCCMMSSEVRFGWCPAFNPCLRYWAHCVGTRPLPRHTPGPGRTSRQRRDGTTPPGPQSALIKGSREDWSELC